MTGRLRFLEAARHVLPTFPDATLVDLRLAHFNNAVFWDGFVRDSHVLFGTLPPNLRSNFELAVAACTIHAQAAAHLPRSILINAEFYIALRRLNANFAYRQAPYFLRRDFNVVRTALQTGYHDFNREDPDSAEFVQAFTLPFTGEQANENLGYPDVGIRDQLLAQVQHYLNEAGFQTPVPAPQDARVQEGVAAGDAPGLDAQDEHRGHQPLEAGANAPAPVVRAPLQQPQQVRRQPQNVAIRRRGASAAIHRAAGQVRRRSRRLDGRPRPNYR